MPYTIRKQKCKQSDGDAGSYVLSYTDKKGKQHRACHTSREKAQGQIAAIEGSWKADEIKRGASLNEDFATMSLIRDYVRQILSEEMINVQGISYDVPDNKVPALVDFIVSKKNLGIKPYALDNVYRDFIASLPPKTGSALDKIITSGIPAAFQDDVKKMLAKKDPKEVAGVLFTESGIFDGTVTVPTALLDIASFSTPGSAGTQIGRGELVVPLLFKNGQVNPGANALYDVIIDGNGWHVKEGVPSSGIRMGSAKDKLFSSTSIYKKLISKGVDPSEFNELSIGRFRQFLPQWAKLMKMTPKALYDMISEQAVNSSVGGALGILWYQNGVLTFTSKDSLQMSSTTQGRVKLSTTGRSKILTP